MNQAEYRLQGTEVREAELVLLATPSEQAHFGAGGEVFAMCYGLVRTWGLVGFEVDLPVEFSPSLLRVGVRHRAQVSWVPVPVDGFPQMGLRVVNVVGTRLRGWTATSLCRRGGRSRSRQFEPTLRQLA